MGAVNREIEEVQEVELDADGYDDSGHYYGVDKPLYMVFFTEEGNFQPDGKVLQMHETFVRADNPKKASELVKIYGHAVEWRTDI